MRKLTCPLTVETIGVNLKAFSENLQSDETKPVMQKYGLLDTLPYEWYSGHTLLEALNELIAQPNFTFNFVAIGMEIGKICPLPPELKDPSIGQVLMVWNDIYQGIHRNGDVGLIRCEAVGSKHYRAVLTDVYPDDFSYGILYGFARRFLPTGTHFKVFYDKEITPRDQGSNGPTIIHLTWE